MADLFNVRSVQLAMSQKVKLVLPGLLNDTNFNKNEVQDEHLPTSGRRAAKRASKQRPQNAMPPAGLAAKGPPAAAVGTPPADASAAVKKEEQKAEKPPVNPTFKLSRTASGATHGCGAHPSPPPGRPVGDMAALATAVHVIQSGPQPRQVSTSWRSSLAGVGTAEAAPSGREVTPAATPGGPVLGHSQAPVPQRLRELSAREAVLVPGDYSFSGETSRRSPSCTRGSLDAWLMQAAQAVQPSTRFPQGVRSANEASSSQTEPNKPTKPRGLTSHPSPRTSKVLESLSPPASSALPLRPDSCCEGEAPQSVQDNSDTSNDKGFLFTPEAFDSASPPPERLPDASAFRGQFTGRWKQQLKERNKNSRKSWSEALPQPLLPPTAVDSRLTASQRVFPSSSQLLPPPLPLPSELLRQREKSRCDESTGGGDKLKSGRALSLFAPGDLDLVIGMDAVPQLPCPSLPSAALEPGSVRGRHSKPVVLEPMGGGARELLSRVDGKGEKRQSTTPADTTADRGQRTAAVSGCGSNGPSLWMHDTSSTRQAGGVLEPVVRGAAGSDVDHIRGGAGEVAGMSSSGLDIGRLIQAVRAV